MMDAHPSRCHGNAARTLVGRVALCAIAFLAIFQPAIPAQPARSVHLEFGNPGGGGQLLDKRIFVISYDTERRIPEWVAYRLRRSDLGNEQPRTEDFRPDPALEDDERSELSDYRGSGYDRGHMAPAADFTRSQRAMSTTFLLSNMTPRRPTLNRRIWARLESQVRDAADEFGTIWVVTGSLFTNQRPPGHRNAIGSGRVAVPTDLYKVVLARDSSGDFSMYAFVTPNLLNPLRGGPAAFIETVDEVERLSGLTFFNELEDTLEDDLENDTLEWPVRREMTP
jgi:endonuclease G, mitochondrial